MTIDRDQQEYRKRVLMRLATSPLSLIPLLGGATLLMGAWAVGSRSGAVTFAGLAGMLTGFGVLFTRLFAGGEKLKTKILKDLELEGERAREKQLDDLEKALGRDGDARTEESLRELRALAAAFHKEELWSKEIDSGSTFDIISGVNRMFETCVDYLKKTLELWETAQRMATDEARAPILDRREQLIQDVRDSIRHISGILARAQTLGMGGETRTDLAGLREELDSSLQVAARVQERIADWGMNDFRLQNSS